MVWTYTLISVLIVSAISLVGVFVIAINEEKLRKILIYLVSFAAGTLLGGAFIHLIPEAFADGGEPAKISVYILGGILFFFIMEKVVKWRHCHEMACDDHPHPFSYNILVGDSLHNFIDGMIIAGSYLVSIPLGIATTLAVIFHEIPQELGDIGSLLYGGFSRSKAILYNFLTALTAVAGAALVLIISAKMLELSAFLVPFAAGGFIYIAGSDLIPELHKDARPARSFWQVITFIFGIGLMFGLLIFE
jgi:zinc and cadmium transporter